MSLRWLRLVLVLSTVATACNTVAPEPPKPARKAKPPAAKHVPAPSAEPPANVPASDHYGLPFAFEKADSEPLGMTRSFLAETIRDNEKYMSRGKAFFEALKKPQQPRATIVTCADSRLQAAAWDETPENDDFTIRNIGNQVLTSLGSVQYGIEHLNTPVLVILGHTGCGAVKAVLSKEHELPKAISAELEGIKLPMEKLEKLQATTKKFDPVWAEAVVENVHQQVKEALAKFGPRVVTGKLTVIGAVYDLVDAFGQGAGRLGIVDVNGNSEPNRLRAFVAAIQDSRNKSLTASPSDAEGQEPAPGSAQNANTRETPRDDLKAAFVDVHALVARGSHAKH